MSNQNMQPSSISTREALKTTRQTTQRRINLPSNFRPYNNTEKIAALTVGQKLNSYVNSKKGTYTDPTCRINALNKVMESQASGEKYTPSSYNIAFKEFERLYKECMTEKECKRVYNFAESGLPQYHNNPTLGIYIIKVLLGQQKTDNPDLRKLRGKISRCKNLDNKLYDSFARGLEARKEVVKLLQTAEGNSPEHNIVPFIPRSVINSIRILLKR